MSRGRRGYCAFLCVVVLFMSTGFVVTREDPVTGNVEVVHYGRWIDCGGKNPTEPVTAADPDTMPVDDRPPKLTDPPPP